MLTLDALAQREEISLSEAKQLGVASASGVTL